MPPGQVMAADRAAQAAAGKGGKGGAARSPADLGPQELAQLRQWMAQASSGAAATAAGSFGDEELVGTKGKARGKGGLEAPGRKESEEGESDLSEVIANALAAMRTNITGSASGTMEALAA